MTHSWPDNYLRYLHRAHRWSKLPNKQHLFFLPRFQTASISHQLYVIRYCSPHLRLSCSTWAAQIVQTSRLTAHGFSRPQRPEINRCLKHLWKVSLVMPSHYFFLLFSPNIFWQRIFNKPCLTWHHIEESPYNTQLQKGCHTFANHLPQEEKYTHQTAV